MLIYSVSTVLEGQIIHSVCCYSVLLFRFSQKKPFACGNTALNICAALLLLGGDQMSNSASLI